MREIILYKGNRCHVYPTDVVTVIDDSDYELCMGSLRQGCHWYLHHNKYARGICMIDGCIAEVAIHQVILNSFKGKIDHIDGNGLNNLRANLRLCNHAQNMRNRKRSISGKLKGVRKHWNSRYIVEITCDKRRHYLGTFETEEEAGSVYDIHAILFFKDFACLNFPEKALLYKKELEDNSGLVPDKYKKRIACGERGHVDKYLTYEI